MRLTGGFWYNVGCLWLLVTWCWKNLAVENSWLLLFPHLYLLYLSSLCLVLVYAMMRLNPSMRITGTPGGGGEERACKVTK